MLSEVVVLKLPCWLNGLMLRWMYLRGQSFVCFYNYASCVNNLPESVEQCQVKQYAAGDAAMFDSVCE